MQSGKLLFLVGGPKFSATIINEDDGQKEDENQRNISVIAKVF